MTKLVEKYKQKYSRNKSDVISFLDYLDLVKSEPNTYASAAERMLKSIGEPVVVDTAQDERLSRIFANRLIRTYPTFHDFYGLENVIDNIVQFFKYAAQGLEESKQILYLLGPVGSSKSSIGKRLKELMEKEPIYVLAVENDGLQISPVFESPLGLLNTDDAEELDIPSRYLEISPSPWAVKRLDEFEGDVSKFVVVKMYPDAARQIAMSKTEPADENNQDVSGLVGKTDIRKLEFYSQGDPDAYSYSGGLCKANQGLLEFVEMFKAPIKTLNPLLEATQDHSYMPTESIGSLPFDGIVLAHSNESEWTVFKNNAENEAFIDRIYIVEVPYCLRVTEEMDIYRKLLRHSSLFESPCAPATLQNLAEFCVLTRLEPPSDKEKSIVSKMRVYNGDPIKAVDGGAKTLNEYKDSATRDEGFSGFSTRLAFKVLSKVFNFDPTEVAANPVHLFHVLESTVKAERLPEDLEVQWVSIIKGHLIPEYIKLVGKDIQMSYLDSYDDYGQAIFDRYILFADHWCQDRDYRDPDTQQMFDREALSRDLEELEKAAKIANPKDFRNEVVNFVIRQRATTGKPVSWRSYEKLRRVVEAKMFSKTEELLPVISFTGHGSKSDQAKHKTFCSNMSKLGYTDKQIKLICEWWIRANKA